MVLTLKTYKLANDNAVLITMLGENGRGGLGKLTKKKKRVGTGLKKQGRVKGTKELP